MSKLLYIIAALILIAAVVPVHADYYISPASLACSPIFPNTLGNAMDGSLSTYIQGNNTDYLDCFIDMGSPVEIKTRAIRQATHDNANYNANFYGTNNSDYSSLTTITELGQGAYTWPSTPEWNNRTTSTQHYLYRYYKVTLLSGLAANLRLYELQFIATGTAPQMIANFTAVPREGTGPLGVAFTDSSTNTTFDTTYAWSILPATGWYPISGTINSQNPEFAFITNGNYSVSLTIQNPSQTANLTRNDYIWIYNSTDLETTYFNVNDLVDGYRVHEPNISLQDIENNSWTNSTADADGTLGIETFHGHHINAYATALGYEPGETLNVDAWNNVYYAIMMQPSEYFNVTEGNVTLRVRVQDELFQGISGAGVSAQKGGGATFTVMTNEAGTVNLLVQNNSVYRVKAEKSGYESATQSVSTGTGSGGDASVSVTLILYKKTVTPTVTATTPTGGGTVTPTITEDPYPCVGDGSAQDTANCKRKQGEMGASLISYGPQLLLFFIILTFIGGAKMIGK